MRWSRSGKKRLLGPIVAALFLISEGGVAAAKEPDVVIPAGANIQQAIDASPEGTTFLLTSGTWTISSTVVPKSGDSLVGAGEGKTVLQGANGSIKGIDSRSKATNVRISDLTVQGFSDGIRTGPRWTVTSVEAAYNVTGIHMYGNYAVVSDSFVHHNRQFGVHGDTLGLPGETSVGQEMLNSEVSYNHTDSSISSGYAGGAKWLNAIGVLILGNNIHDNYGNGLWLDQECEKGTITGNRLSGNTEDGVRIEISSSIVIEGNDIRANGENAVDIFNSHDVTVRSNTIVAPAEEFQVLRFLSNGRTDSAGVEYANYSNRAESNVITLSSTSQRVGVVRSAGMSYGNTFATNTYRVPSSGPRYFSWWDGTRAISVSWSTWVTKYGQDKAGALQSI